MSREKQTIDRLFQKLLACEPVTFPKLRKPLDAPTQKGVYLVLNPSDAVLHVGSTPRARSGIRQRLRAHLQSKSSFVKKYLKGQGSKLRLGYKFKYVKVKKARTRAILEAYAIGQLLPKHIGTGEAKDG